MTLMFGSWFFLSSEAKRTQSAVFFIEFRQSRINAPGFILIHHLFPSTTPEYTTVCFSKNVILCLKEEALMSSKLARAKGTPPYHTTDPGDTLFLLTPVFHSYQAHATLVITQSTLLFPRELVVPARHPVPAWVHFSLDQVLPELVLFGHCVLRVQVF